MYGNPGFLTVVVLVCFYVYFGWVKPIRNSKSRDSHNDRSRGALGVRSAGECAGMS